jgi:hypothetical protein
MTRIELLLVRRLLPRLLAGACDATVPRSGTEGERVNCYTTTVRDGDDPNLVLLSLEGRDVKGLKFDGRKYSIEVTENIDSIEPRHLRVTHFYGLDEVRFQGIWAVACARWTKWPYVQIHLRRAWNKLAQALFNRRALASQKRLALLQQVVNWTSDNRTPIGAMDVMTLRYGYRWASRPEWESHHDQLEQQLKMLVETGDLRGDQHRFLPTGQAIKTLEDSEESDRRHTANFRVQLLLAILTFVTSLMAAAQAGLIRVPVLVDLAPKTTQEEQASCKCLPR